MIDSKDSAAIHPILGIISKEGINFEERGSIEQEFGSPIAKAPP